MKPRILSSIKDPRAVTPLLAGLSDTHLTVRLISARLLGEIGDVQAAEPLLEAMRNQPPMVLPDILTALGEMLGKLAASPGGAARAVEVIRSCQFDPSPSVRRAAIEALALGFSQNCREPRGVETLLAALQSPDPDLRRSAVIGLENGCKLGYKDQHAVPPLLAALKDEATDIRQHAAAALVALTGQVFGTDPARWEEWWKAQ